MARNYFFKDRWGGQSGPVSFEELVTLAKLGRITRDCLVWTEGGEPALAGEFPGLTEMLGKPQTPAARFGSGPLSGAFSGWDLIWRFYVFGFGLLSLAFAPLAGRWVYGFVASRIALPSGQKLSLDAPLASCWWIFLGIGAAFVAPILVMFVLLGQNHDMLTNPEAIKAIQHRLQPMNFAANVVFVVLSYALVCWFVRSLRSEDGALNIVFTGGFWTFVGWDLLIGLSFFTIIGWAWAVKGKLSWICRRIEGSHRLDYIASGLEILWRCLAAFLGPALIFILPIAVSGGMKQAGQPGAAALFVLIGVVGGVVALAKALGWLVNWQISQFVVSSRAA